MKHLLQDQKRILVWCIAALITAILTNSCATTPEIKPEPKSEAKPIPPAPPPKFAIEPYHSAMQGEMRQSYEKADEILIGVFSGSNENKQKDMTYYFEDFSRFEKTTLSWDPVMNVLVQVYPDAFKPQIITAQEFKSLSDLDLVGICWDSYEQARDWYLIEGERILIFLELGYDEINDRSYRHLIDSYPVTPECNSKAVFDLMVSELFE